MKKTVMICGLLSAALYAGAQDTNLRELAKSQIADGLFNEAIETLRTELSANPSGKEAGIINALMGEAYMGAGDFGSAQQALARAKEKGNAEATLLLGRLAYLEYDFDRAAELYSQYAGMKGKHPEWENKYDEFDSQLDMAGRFLDQVAKIVVIDSIDVPTEQFFEAYRLSPSAGRLLTDDKAPVSDDKFVLAPVFRSEGGDFMMWTSENQDGDLVVEEATLLTDGSWHIEVAPEETLNGGGNAAYPYMMADGTTLYFANDGEESIGELDIFVVTRDSSTGEYLMPQNVGMPFNSPFDDYLLVIDEEKEIGWWATDRNRVPGKTTVYVFIPSETRMNYDSEDEDLIDYARIADFRATWDDQNYEDLAESLRKEVSSEDDEVDFVLPVPGGKVLTSFTQLSAAQSRAMRSYLAAEERLQEASDKLQALRMKYRRGDNSSAILEGEKSLEKARQDMKKARNDVYRLF